MFIRDEEANLVWATERLITLGDGTQVRNGDDQALVRGNRLRRPGRNFACGPMFPAISFLMFRAFSISQRRRARYICVEARTVEAASLAAPQYRSRVVAESWRLNEAEVPRTGVRVRRTHRYARGSDGNGYFWIGRHKQTAPRTHTPGLRFDFLEEPPA